MGAFGIKRLPAAHARPGVQQGLWGYMSMIPLLGSPERDAEGVSHLLEGFLPLLGFNHVGGAAFPLIVSDIHDGISHLLSPLPWLPLQLFCEALGKQWEVKAMGLY